MDGWGPGHEGRTQPIREASGQSVQVGHTPSIFVTQCFNLKPSAPLRSGRSWPRRTSPARSVSRLQPDECLAYRRLLLLLIPLALSHARRTIVRGIECANNDFLSPNPSRPPWTPPETARAAICSSQRGCHAAISDP